MTDHGKGRVFRCWCGGECLRPMTGTPTPCDRCDADLQHQPFEIVDRHTWMRRRYAEALGELKKTMDDLH